MNIINIAFSFDHNFFRQASVAIVSLLSSAEKNTILNIYCLCADDVSNRDIKLLKKIFNKNSKSGTINFFRVGNLFDSSFEIRGITKGAYFRLVLHKILSNIDNVIYSDVDILFKKDLSDIYKLDLGKNLLGAVKATAINLEETFNELTKNYDYWEKHLFNIRGSYFNSGFLLMNLKEIRKSNLENKWIEMSKKDFFFVDQDILNITCKNRIVFLHPKYNVIAYALDSVYDKLCEEGILKKEEISEVFENPSVIHWAGEKPWNNKSLNYANEWWGCVKKTPFYNYFFIRYKIIKIKEYFEGIRKRFLS